MYKCKICWKEFRNRYAIWGHIASSHVIDFEGKMMDKIVEYNKNPNKCWFCWKDILHIKWRLTDTKRKRFCNKSCSASRQSKKEKPPKRNIKKEIDDRNFRRIEEWYKWFITPAQLKRLLIKIRWHKCENCWLEKWLDWEIPLELHHINWDSLDNGADNLSLLCPNCHTLTDNYKSKNKKSTRNRYLW